MSRAAGPRVAIVGAGLMGRWHADAVARIGGRVTVIVDRNLDALSAMGRAHPAARLMTELDPSVVIKHAEAAHVCTPLATHTALIAGLLEAGVHVMAEKPVAETAEKTAMLLSLAGDHGVMLCPVHQFLFQDGVRRLLRWLPDMGVLRRIEFSACSAGAAGEDPTSLDELIGEILPHPLALVGAMARSPAARMDWSVAHPVAGEFVATATAGDAIVSIAISAHGRPTENLVRAVADGGSASADLFHGYSVRHGPTVSRRAKVTHPFLVSGRALGGASLNLVKRAARREPAYPGLRELLRAFYTAIARDGAPPIAPEAVLDVAAARDTLLSKLEGRGH